MNEVLANGTVLNNCYRINSVINNGSNSIVYLAEDIYLKQNVALKEFFPKNITHRDAKTLICVNDVSDEAKYDELLDKYVEEAVRLSMFKDLEGVVRELNCFRGNNTAYVVMEYMEGITLNELINHNGQLNLKEAVNILQPVLYALKIIHEKGFFWGNIQSDNIIINNNYTCLIDYGSENDIEAVIEVMQDMDVYACVVVMCELILKKSLK